MSTSGDHGNHGRGPAQHEGQHFVDGGRDNSHSARQNASGEFGNARLSDVRQSGYHNNRRDNRSQDCDPQGNQAPRNRPQDNHDPDNRSHLPNLQIDARAQAHGRVDIDFNPNGNHDRDRGRNRDHGGNEPCPPQRPEPRPCPPKPEPPCPPKPEHPHHPPKPEPCPPKPEPPCPPKPEHPHHPPKPEPCPPKPEPPCPPKPEHPHHPPKPEPCPPRPEPPCHPPEPCHPKPPHHHRPDPCEPSYPPDCPPWQGPGYPPIPPIDCSPKPRPDCNPVPIPPCNGPIEWYPPIPDFGLPPIAPPVLPSGSFDFNVSVSVGGDFSQPWDFQPQFQPPVPSYSTPTAWDYPAPAPQYQPQPEYPQQWAQPYYSAQPGYPASQSQWEYTQPQLQPQSQQQPQYEYPTPLPRPQPQQPPQYEYPAPQPQPQKPPQYEYPAPLPQPQPLPPEQTQPYSPQEFPYQPPEFNPGVENGDGTVGRFPPRNPNALPGSKFFTAVLGANPNDSHVLGVMGPEREAAIIREIESGNIPDFLRHPKTIRIQDQQGNTAEFQVLPDYLAIGSNEDYVRVPLTPAIARAVANKYGFDLPTEKLCKAIYNQPDAVKMVGIGLVNQKSDTKYMEGNGFALKHDRLIDDQLQNVPPGSLIAGHKKDIILSNFAAQHPDRLDFYGLYKANGSVYQGSGGGPHEVTYEDYSHGARLVSQKVIVNGVPMSYEQLLNDPRYSQLVSDEGPINSSRTYR